MAMNPPSNPGYTTTLYPLSNYTFGAKEAQPEDDPSVQARMSRLKEEYELIGMRRTVEAVLLVHQHNHPHILTLQIGTYFKLPGDTLKPGEDEVDGLYSRLTTRLAPNGVTPPDWEIKDLLAMWARPNYENHLYPYVPAHINVPKEQKKIFLVQLPEKCSFQIPKNMKLMAIPLWEIYENQKTYGGLISSIPHLLSRFNFTYAQ